tara:strand:- start:5245 stop:6405 length:1161 start_codon:yes stop_codon:yes gene_type:complete
MSGYIRKFVKKHNLSDVAKKVTTGQIKHRVQSVKDVYRHRGNLDRVLNKLPPSLAKEARDHGRTLQNKTLQGLQKYGGRIPGAGTAQEWAAKGNKWVRNKLGLDENTPTPLPSTPANMGVAAKKPISAKREPIENPLLGENVPKISGVSDLAKSLGAPDQTIGKLDPELETSGHQPGVTIGNDETRGGLAFNQAISNPASMITNYFGKFGSPLTSDRYLVTIQHPAVLYDLNLTQHYGFTGDMSDTQLMSWFGCRTATLPGKQISTFQSSTNGAEKDYPYIIAYENIDMSFVCTSNAMLEKRWFDQWQAGIIHPEDSSVSYKADFTSKINMGIFNMHNDKVLDVEIENAYPISVSSIELAHANGEEIMTFTVTFAYDKWKYAELVE